MIAMRNIQTYGVLLVLLFSCTQKPEQMSIPELGPDPRHWWGEMRVSGDGGVSWSVSRRLGEGRLGPLLGPVKNKPVQMKDGTIFCPSSTEQEEKGELRWRVHFELTRDLGNTWEVIGPINEGQEFDAIQPSILTYENGIMQVLCRTRQQVISRSWSEDGGRTWSRMTATSLPNPNAGTDAVTLEDGRHPGFRRAGAYHLYIQKGVHQTCGA